MTKPNNYTILNHVDRIRFGLEDEKFTRANIVAHLDAIEKLMDHANSRSISMIDPASIEPGKRGRKPHHPWLKVDVGESFSVPITLANALKKHAILLRNSRAYKAKYARQFKIGFNKEHSAVVVTRIA